MRHSLPAVCAAIAASLLGACSDSRIMASREGAPPSAETRDRSASPVGNTAIRERFASAALDDRRLGEVRGGLSTSSGLIVNFSFQEATYVNHNLTQSIVVPTITVSPGATPAAIANATGSGSANLSPSAIAALGNSITQVQVSAPALAVQSVVNNGMTSVVSSIGGGGITSTISNSANSQLVQQVITANIAITGLSQTIQQSVAATVLSRVAAANSQFR